MNYRTIGLRLTVQPNKRVTKLVLLKPIEIAKDGKTVERVKKGGIVYGTYDPFTYGWIIQTTNGNHGFVFDIEVEIYKD